VDAPKAPDTAERPDPRHSGRASAFLRRRAVALSAIALMIIVPATLLIGQLEGDDAKDRATTVVIPQTPKSFKDAKLGVEVRWPKDWRSKIDRKAGRLELTSKDHTTVFSLAVEPGASGPKAKAFFRSAVLAVANAYKNSRYTLSKLPQRVSGLPTASGIVRGTNKKNVKLTISVTVARGRKKLYLIEIFAPQRGGRVGDLAVIGRTLKLTG
jgi:hypothetical protein